MRDRKPPVQDQPMTLSPTHSQRLEQAVAAFLWAARRSLRLGLQASTGGNISLRVSPARILTKPTGLGMAECRPADLVLVDDKGGILKGGKPTKEIHAHLGVYRERPDLGAIVHYHAPFATAYAVAGLPLPVPTLHAARILGQVPVVPPHPEGSLQLAEATVRALADPECKGILLARHGLMAAGPTLRQAQYLAELMEESAKIDWLSRLLNPFI